MFTAASSTAIIAGMFSDTGTILGATIAVVLGGAVALVGLGFAFRRLKKYITGHKF